MTPAMTDKFIEENHIDGRLGVIRQWDGETGQYVPRIFRVWCPRSFLSVSSLANGYPAALENYVRMSFFVPDNEDALEVFNNRGSSMWIGLSTSSGAMWIDTEKELKAVFAAVTDLNRPEWSSFLASFTSPSA